MWRNMTLVSVLEKASYLPAGPALVPRFPHVGYDDLLPQTPNLI